MTDEPMSQRHWLAVKRYVTDIRATYRDLRNAGRPMQHLVPLFDEAERLKGERDRLAEQVKRARGMHRRRVDRHGAGCVQCGIVWPCPTYNALSGTEAGQ